MVLGEFVVVKLEDFTEVDIVELELDVIVLGEFVVVKLEDFTEVHIVDPELDEFEESDNTGCTGESEIISTVIGPGIEKHKMTKDEDEDGISTNVLEP
jgi:hypothetical protein